MNRMYGLARAAFGNAGINWLADDIKAVLIDVDDYVVSIDVHQFLSDIPVGARVATSPNLAGKTNVLGTLDANNLTFAAVLGDESEALVIYQDTGVAGTSKLIAYIDTVLSGLPVTPSGADILVQWDNGANKILTI